VDLTELESCLGRTEPVNVDACVTAMGDQGHPRQQEEAQVRSMSTPAQEGRTVGPHTSMDHGASHAGISDPHPLTRKGVCP